MGGCFSKPPALKYAVAEDGDLEKHAQKGIRARTSKRQRLAEAGRSQPSASKRTHSASRRTPSQSTPPSQQATPRASMTSTAESKAPTNDNKQQTTDKPSPSPAPPAPTPSPAPKPKLNIKDFQFKQCKGEAKVKAPGSINGQAFMIDECTDCDLYVLDSCAAVTIDDSKNCRIFIGPTDGSIFMRNCSNVKCCFIGRQIRLRDITNSSVAMLCRTKPILESSTNVSIMCYDLLYQGLPDQLKSVKLDPFHNFWDSIHDFTPKPESWRYLPPETKVTDLMAPIPEEAQTAMGETKLGQPPLMSTWGNRPPPGPAHLLVLFPASKEEHALQLVAHVHEEQAEDSMLPKSGNAYIDEVVKRVAPPEATSKPSIAKVYLKHTNKTELSSSIAAEITKCAGWPDSTAKQLAGVCCGLEFVGEDGMQAGLRSKAQELGGLVTDRMEAAEQFRYFGIEG